MPSKAGEKTRRVVIALTWQALACGVCLMSSGIGVASAQERPVVAPVDSERSADDPCAKKEEKPREEDPKWYPPPMAEEDQRAIASFECLNEHTMGLYRAERERMQREGAVVISRFGATTLFIDGEIIETQRTTPLEYNNLRYASHPPLAIYAALYRVEAGKGKLSSAQRARLTEYVKQLNQGVSLIGTLDLTPDQRLRQVRLFRAASKYLRGVLASGVVDQEALLSYARSNSLDVERNMRDAGYAQVRAMHRQMLLWRPILTDQQWCNIRFVTRGFPQARGGYATTLYFSKLVGDPGDGRGYVGESERVIFREQSRSQAPAWRPEMELLATIRLDAKASQAIFGDPDGLTVDVAYQGAREAVQDLDLSGLTMDKCGQFAGLKDSTP